ncbi:DUF3575 domain-containing protein [Flavivirga rizhaonensis]|uniref:DUF3575 domain-containing protein n=1 Tax=Flavivirga rizhaonensis TaxID=2559571 RepID=A0A4S1DXG3_9FLAO|nr:DUF3575 domain-containing protein [Flavivirga rizhaonensis]TGV02856.1 DUF3575 domain-containing protein [Flavivirga rizhaonensis]
MKKLLFLLLLLVSCFSFSQEEENIKSHEIKINAFNAIIFKSVDFSYEYLIDSESSVGVSVFFNLHDPEEAFLEDGPVYNEEFALTPYYRHFFSNKYAWGFFLEAFGMYNVQKDFDGYYDNNLDRNVLTEGTSNNVALGIALGGKFVSKKGFAFEFLGGLGRNLSQSNDAIGTELVPRIAASLGYRF